MAGKFEHSTILKITLPLNIINMEMLLDNYKYCNPDTLFD